MKKILVALVLLLASCASSPFSDPRSATLPIMVKGEDSAYCSGVMVERNRMLTADHCVRDDMLVGGKPAKALQRSAEDDVALLEVEEDCPCAPVARYAPDVDEPLVVVGYPMNSIVLTQTLTEGRAQGEAGPDNERRLRMNVPVAPGNSGGGVFVKRGDHWELVGIVSALVQHCNGFFCSQIHHLSLATTTDSLRKILAKEAA